VIDPEAYGRRLRALRDRTGHTQDDVGRAVDLHKSTIAKIEAGVLPPPRKVSFYEDLRKLAGVQKEDIVALLRGDGAPDWLIQDQDDPQVQKVPIPGGDNLEFELSLRLADGVERDEETDALLQELAEDIKARVRLYLREKKLTRTSAP